MNLFIKKLSFQLFYIEKIFIMSNLQVKEIKGISIKNTIRFAICHDDFYLYSDNYDNIYSFDQNSISNSIFSFPDKKVKGHITALDFSPSRKYAAAGYTDGAIQVFDLDSNKPYKLLSKPSGNSVQCIVFYSDTFLLSGFSNGSFVSYKIAFIPRENHISNFSSRPLRLYRPAIYRFVDGNDKSSKVVLPNFVDCFAVSTEKSFQISILAKDFISSKDKLNIPTGNLIPCFYTIDSRNVLMAVAYTDKVEIYSLSYTEDLQITKQASISTSYPLVFLSFLSPMILIGHDQDCQHFLMLSSDTNSSTELNSPITGFPIQGDSNLGPTFINDNKLYRLNLQPFTSIIESYYDSVEKAELAIDYCKKAISNDPISTISLPSNQYQRLLVIERSISPILSNYLSSQLNDHPENAETIAEKFVNISIDLKLQDWLINEAISIFESKGKLRIIVEKIIKNDPCAALFGYNRKFVESIMNSFDNKSDDEDKSGVSISNFLLSLPSRILTPIEIIKYAEKTGSHFLLAQLYAIRLNDLTSALQILANVDMFSNICVLIIHNQEKIDISIQWCFTFVKGKFPYIEKICRCKDAKDVFFLFENRIEEKKSPVNISDFVNAMIQTLYFLQNDQKSTENSEFINNYLIKMQNLLISKQVKLLASTLKCIVTIIFSKKLPDNDPEKKRLEKILIYILSSDVPVQFKEPLLNLCEPFGFQETKRRMEEGARKYESAIKESLLKPEKDVFKLIDDLISKAQSNPSEFALAQTSIRNALLTFAPYFIVKDVKKFANLINKKFYDSALGIVREVQDENVRNIFIRNLYQVEQSADFLKLPTDLFLKYVTYLSKYYSHEVYGLIKLYPCSDVPVEDLIPICRSYHIYDACSYLSELTNDASKASDYVVKYQQVQLLLFAQKKISIELATNVTNYVLNFVKERVKKKAIIDETRKMSIQLVNAMLAPLYELQKQGVKSDNERVNFITTYLKTICSTVASVVPYPAILDIFIQQFKELNYGYASLALSSIMNDYSYDIDTTNAMCDLYRQDERNDHSRLILNYIAGVENDNIVCCTCKKRLVGVLDQIQVFPCGHVFHRNISCLPKQVCPVCNPEERLDQDVPIHTLAVNIGRSQLRRFEFNLKKHNSVFRQKEKFEDKKDSIVINPGAFASFE